MFESVTYYLSRRDIRLFFLGHFLISSLQAIFEGLFVFYLSQVPVSNLFDGSFLRTSELLYFFAASVFFRILLIYSNYICLSTVPTIIVRSLAKNIQEYDSLNLTEQRNCILQFLRNRSDVLYYQFHQPITSLVSLVSVFIVVVFVFIFTFPSIGFFVLTFIAFTLLIFFYLAKSNASKRSSVIAEEIEKFYNILDHIPKQSKRSRNHFSLKLTEMVNSYATIRSYVSLFQIFGLFPRFFAEALLFIFLLFVLIFNVKIEFSTSIVVVVTYVIIRLAPVLVRGFASVSVMFGAKDIVLELKNISVVSYSNE